VGYQRADVSEIAFGMVLAQVHRQVRDPARMRLVMAQGTGTERATHPVHDLGGRRLDERAHPQGPQAAAVLAVIGVRVDLSGGSVKRRLRGRQGKIDGAEMRQGVRATSRRAAAASSVRPTPRAPPYQQAATPAPPWAKPGRSR
jgi:hypothetical protein